MLFPIDSSDKSIAGHLICLIIATIHEPKISLINQCNEIASLTLNDIRRPNESLRFETGRVIGWENRSVVRPIPIDHHNTIAARFALLREDSLKIRDLIIPLPRIRMKTRYSWICKHASLLDHFYIRIVIERYGADVKERRVFCINQTRRWRVRSVIQSLAICTPHY